MQVKSGVDWFELHGRVDFGDGRSVAIADLLAALRRGEATVILDDGTRGMVPEEWLRRYMRIAAFGESQDDHVRFRSTQTALLDALLEAQPAVRIDEAFARARAELTQFSGIRPLDAAAVVSRQAARVSVRGARLVRVPAPLRLRRVPRRRHGARQDRHGARAARGAPRLAREGSRRARRSRSCRDRSSTTGSRRRAGSRPELTVLDYTGDARAIGEGRRLRRRC